MRQGPNLHFRKGILKGNGAGNDGRRHAAQILPVDALEERMSFDGVHATRPSAQALVLKEKMAGN